MEYTTKTKDSNGIDYKEYNGTFYTENTPDEIVKIIDRLLTNRTRVRFHWGDVKTGKDWGDIYDVAGRIGRSTGTIKIPLLVHNTRSYGGGALLTGSIVKITYANKKDGGTIYQHPQYHI